MKIYLYGSIAWKNPFGIGQVIDWAKQYAWDGIDARGMSLDAPGDRQKAVTAFGYDMLGPRNVQPSARAALRQKLRDTKIPLLGIYCSVPVNLPGHFGKTCRGLFAQYLQLGADLGVEWIRAINNTCSDAQGGTMSSQEAYERTVDGLREVASRAADLGIGLLLENNENTIPSDAQTLLRLKADVGERCRVGIAYDAVNAYFQGSSPMDELKLLAGNVDVLHAKNVRRHSGEAWKYMPRGDYCYEWTSLVDGDIDWAGILRQAADGGFDGPVVYEYVNPFKGMPSEYWNSLPEPAEAARREAAYLRSVLRLQAQSEAGQME